MDFYFDESKHPPPRGDFVVGAFVGADSDVGPDVSAALLGEGLTPGKDEYKSSANMTAHPEQRRLRDRLHGVLSQHGRIALVVLPGAELPSLGAQALSVLGQLIAQSDSPTGTPIEHSSIDKCSRRRPQPRAPCKRPIFRGRCR